MAFREPILTCRIFGSVILQVALLLYILVSIQQGRGIKVSDLKCDEYNMIELSGCLGARTAKNNAATVHINGSQKKGRIISDVVLQKLFVLW
jgi:hypothetical protein